MPLVAPSGVQRGAKQCAKRGLGFIVTPSRIWDPILEELGRLWGPSGHAFCDVLGSPGGAKWVPKASKNGAKRGLDVIVALSRLWDLIFRKIWEALGRVFVQ